MLLDITTTFSGGQSFGHLGANAVALSTNTIDFLGPRRGALGAGGPIDYEILGAETGVNVPAISIFTTEAFTNLTSLSIAFETFDTFVLNPNGVGAQYYGVTELYRSPAYTPAQLVPGVTRFRPDRLPVGKYKRYINLRYYIVGAAPAFGKISAGLTDFEITRVN